jgi:tetratricopeptide (TPR) repeat protein
MSKPRRERRREQRAQLKSENAEVRRVSRTVLPFKRWEWIALAGILLFGLVFRLVYLTEVESSPAFRYPAFDAAFHDYWARSLASGDWSAPQIHDDPRIHETPFFRPPGYPYFLAGVYILTGQSYLAARIIQMIIGLGCCVLAFLFGRSLFGRGVGLIFSALMSCYWIFVFFEGELLAPVLLVFFALATMLAFARWLDQTTYINTIATGVLLGLFALVRPNALILVPVALAWIWWVARRRKVPRRFRLALLGFPLGVALAIAPATIRNYVVADDLVLITSNSGVNLYIGNNEQTDCVNATIPILGEHTTMINWTCFDQPAIVALVERIEGRALKASEVSRFFTRKALDYISGNPAETAAHMWKKALLFWGPAEISNNKVIHFERAHSPVLKFLPGFPLALALAIVGLLFLVLDFRAGRKNRGAATIATSRRFEITVLLLAFVVVYFASYLPFFIAGRYRVPIIPFLLLFGAYGIERTYSLAYVRRFTHVAIWIGVFAVAYLLTSRQYVAYEPDLGTWHFDRGDAYRKQGEIELAVAEFSKAVDVNRGRDPQAYNNLGAALMQLERYEEAAREFERAVEINPKYLAARQNLVQSLLRTNRPQAAHGHLLEIVRLDPGDAIARFNLAVSLLQQDKINEAMVHLAKAVELDPNFFNAQYYLAKTLAITERQEEAIKRYQIALRLAKNNIVVRYELATLLTETGRRSEAIPHLERVLEVKPDHEGARKLLNRPERK